MNHWWFGQMIPPILCGPLLQSSSVVKMAPNSSNHYSLSCVHHLTPLEILTQTQENLQRFWF